MTAHAGLTGFGDADRMASPPLSRSVTFGLAFTYALVLSSLPLFAFRDRENYLVYADNSFDIFSAYFEISPLVALFNEPLWLMVNSALRLFLTPEMVLRTIIFLPAFTVSYTVLRARPEYWPWLLVFLLVPQVLKNHITHLRQGTAIAVFIAIWFSSLQGWRRQALFIIPAFIHASFFFVLMLQVMTWALKRLRMAADIRGATYLMAGIAVGIGLGLIAAMLGARQAGRYEFEVAAVSGVGFAFWLIVLFLFVLQGRNLLQQHSLAFGTLVFYLSTYFLVEVTARIFESTVLLVLTAGLGLTGWRKPAFLSAVAGYCMLQWTQRFLRDGPMF